LQNKNRKNTDHKRRGRRRRRKRGRRRRRATTKTRKEGKGLWKGELNLEFDDFGFYQLQKDLTGL
jgi:hypothetical protein